MKESLVFSEVEKSFDTVGREYLRGIDQYRNSVIEIAQNANPQYDELKTYFRNCVSLNLPYFQKENIETYQSLPIFAEELAADKDQNYFDYQYEKAHLRVYPKKSIKIIDECLEELHTQYLESRDVPEDALEDIMSVKNGIIKYTETIESQKNIYGESINANLKEFIKGSIKYSGLYSNTIKGLTDGEGGIYIVNLSAVPKEGPIIQKLNGKKLHIPQWKPAKYSDIFDLAEAANRIILERSLKEVRFGKLLGRSRSIFF